MINRMAGIGIVEIIASMLAGQNLLAAIRITQVTGLQRTVQYAFVLSVRDPSLLAAMES